VGDWDEWSKCSKECGEGTKTRSRVVTAESKYGGKCDDALEDKKKCKKKDCPVPCTVSDWDDWSACSATCGDGTMTRERTVTADAQHGGACVPLQESDDCKDKECPVPCKMGDWDDWSDCSKQCGEGTRTRTRSVAVESKYGGKCEDAKEATEKCKKKDCPVPCELSDWEEWTACSATCGDGTMTRTRTVITEAQHGGTCPKLEDSDDCNKGPCPVPCTVSDWGDWSKCDKQCGEGTRTRTRTVTSVAKYGGECLDAMEASEKCKEKDCPIPCTVTDWDDWSDCTVSCGGGTKTRERTVTADAQHGGSCPDLDDSEECNKDGCPTPCELCDWEEWSDCSQTAGEGTRTRKREISVEATNGGECDVLNENDACCLSECTGPEPTLAPFSTDFEVCGTVKNAEDNSAIPGAKVEILDKVAESNATGGFCIQKVPDGASTLTSTKDGWVDTNMSLDPITEDTKGILVYMSKKFDSPKDWRIVLTWGKTPLDLDARTQFGDDADTCAVSYASRSATCAQNDIQGKIDLDHCFYSEEKNAAGDRKHSCNKSPTLPGGPSDEPKPETTTLTNVDPAQGGKITFHVSNYMVCLAWKTCPAGTPSEDTGTLAASQAEVKVIHGDKEVAFYQLAQGEGNIRYQNYGAQYEEWWVFYIDVKESKVVTCTDKNCY
jgi:hypothetical protein